MKTRAQVAGAILSNPETLANALVDAQNSAGSALKENAAFMDSIEGKTNRLKQSISELWTTAIDSDVIKMFLDLGIAITDLIGNVGLLETALGATFLAFSTFKNFGVFKTVANEAKLSGKEISAFGITLTDVLNRLKGSDVSIEGDFTSSLAGDTDALDKFFKTWESGVSKQEAFDRTMNRASDSAKEFAKSANMGAENSKDFAKQQTAVQAQVTSTGIASKAAAVGVGVLKAALNTLVGIGIGLAITAGVEAITNLVNANKLSAEAAIKAKEEVESLTNTLKENEKTVKSLKDRYAELAQGVDQFSNARKTISSDDYKEFLDISNQIAELFPELVSYYDENGNAILSLNGDVEKITSAFEALIRVKRQEANQEISEKLPKIFNEASSTAEKYEKVLDKILEKQKFLSESGNDFSKLFGSESFSKSWEEFVNTGSFKLDAGNDIELFNSAYDTMNKMLEELGIKFLGGYGEEQGQLRFEVVKPEDLAENKDLLRQMGEDYSKTFDYIEGKANEARADIEKTWAGIKAPVYSWLTTSSEDFSNLTASMQGAVQAALGGIWEGLDLKDWKTDALPFLQNEFMPIFKDLNEDLQTQFTQLFTFNGDTSSAEFVESAKTVIDSIKTSLGSDLTTAKAEALDSIFESVTEKYTENLQVMSNRVLKEITDIDYDAETEKAKKELINGLNDQEIEILLNTKIDKNATIDELKEAIEDARKVAAQNPIEISTLFKKGSDSAEELENFKSTIQSVKEALSKTGNLTGSDVFDVMSSIPEADWDAYASGAKTYAEVLNDLAENSLSSLIKKYPQLEGLLRGLYTESLDSAYSIELNKSKIEELTGVLDKVKNKQSLTAQEVISLSTKYGDLTSAIEKNAQGYTIEEKALTTLINKYANDANTSIVNQTNKTKEVLKQTKIRIKAYVQESEALYYSTRMDADKYAKLQEELQNPLTTLERKKDILGILGEGRKVGDIADNPMFTYFSSLIKELEGAEDELVGLESSLEEVTGSKIDTDKTKSLNDFSEALDWVKIKYQNLEDAVASFETKFENSKTYKEKIEVLKELKTAQEDLQAAYSEGAGVYEGKYNEALAKIAALGVNPDKYEKLIKEGGNSVQDFIDKGIASGKKGANEQLYKLLNEATNYYNSMSDSKKKHAEIKIDIDDTALKEFEIKDSKRQDDISLIENLKSDTMNFIDEAEARGTQAEKEHYQQVVYYNDRAIKYQQDRIDEISKYMKDNNIVYGHEEYEKWKSTLQDCEDSIASLTRENIELGKTILKLPIQKYEEANKLLEEQLDKVSKYRSTVESAIGAAGTLLQSQIDGLNDQKEATEEFWDKQIEAVEKQKEALEESNDELERQIALEKAQYNLQKLREQETVKVYKKGEGFVYETDKDAIRDAEEEVNKAKDDIKLAEYDKTIDALNKQKESAVEAIDAQIKSWTKYQDLLNDITSSFEDMIAMQDLVAIFGENAVSKIMSQDLAILGTFETALNTAKTQEKELQEKIDANNKLIEEIEKQAEAWAKAEVTVSTAQKNIRAAISDNKAEISSIEKRSEKTKELGASWNTTKDAIVDSLKKITSTGQAEAEKEKTILGDRVNTLSNFKSAAVSLLSDVSKALSDAQSSYSSLIDLVSKSQSAYNQINSLNTPSPTKPGKTKSIDEYHSGGIVGRSKSVGGKDLPDIIMSISNEPLRPNEMYAKLLEDEVVLNNRQMENLFGNYSRALGQSFGIPKIDSGQSIQFEMGDVNVYNPDNSDAIVNEIVNDLPLKMIQKINSKK